MVVDLGAELFARWRAAGSGVEPIGRTAVRVTDAEEATIDGIRLKGINQTDRKGLDLGGTEFRFGGG